MLRGFLLPELSGFRGVLNGHTRALSIRFCFVVIDITFVSGNLRVIMILW